MRVNLFAGPGAGKSATAKKLAGELSARQHDIELISEYIKGWAYQGIVPVSTDQFYIFAKQLRAEDLVLRKVRHIVSDSPLTMQCAYIERNQSPYLEETLSMTQKWESQHPSINIFLDREGIEYKQNGRYENPAQAIAMDQRIESFLNRHAIPFTRLKTIDFAGIMKFVEERL